MRATAIPCQVLRRRAPRQAPARRWLLWPLMLALLVYGLNASVLQVLGPSHRHVTADAMPGQATAGDASAAVSSVAPNLLTTLLAWHAGLRERLHLHAHTRGVFVHVHQPDADPAVRPVHDVSLAPAWHAARLVAGESMVPRGGLIRVQGTANQAAHDHLHAANERHHHAAGDDSVVKSGSDAIATDALKEAASTSAAGSAMLPLGLACLPIWAPPAPGVGLWPAGHTALWTSAAQRHPERPPRA